MEELIKRYAELANRCEARRAALKHCKALDRETFCKLESKIESYTVFVYDMCEQANKEFSIENVTEYFMDILVTYEKIIVE